jgi:hypothetical protein
LEVSASQCVHDVFGFLIATEEVEGVTHEGLLVWETGLNVKRLSLLELFIEIDTLCLRQLVLKE